MPKLQSSIVRGLRAHSNRKIGNLAVEALLAPQGRNLQVGGRLLVCCTGRG